ncbi:hypothetical protein OJ998_15715 [Solirubrobacter taibaiensis]|nr:hypothetical protein [Solirubrobacter taibaiensis]
MRDELIREIQERHPGLDAEDLAHSLSDPGSNEPDPDMSWSSIERTEHWHCALASNDDFDDTVVHDLLEVAQALVQSPHRAPAYRPDVDAVRRRLGHRPPNQVVLWSVPVASEVEIEPLALPWIEWVGGALPYVSGGFREQIKALTARGLPAQDFGNRLWHSGGTLQYD